MATEIKERYIANDIGINKSALFESFGDHRNFNDWYDDLPEKTKQEIDAKFNDFVDNLSHNLLLRKVILPDEKTKIVNDISDSIYDILIQIEWEEEIDNEKIPNPEVISLGLCEYDEGQESETLNNLKNSANKILGLYDELLAVLWIQEANSLNLSLDSIIARLLENYGKNNVELSYIFESSNLLQHLISIGIVNQKLDKIEVFNKLSSISNSKNIALAFNKFKKEGAKSEIETAGLIIQKILQNHSDKVVIRLGCTLFESISVSLAFNYGLANLMENNLDKAAIGMLWLFSTQLVGFCGQTLGSKIDNTMQYGFKSEESNFYGLEPYIIDLIRQNPKYLSKYDSIELKQLIGQYKDQYNEIYSSIFNGILPALVGVVGSAIGISTILENSEMAIIPPLVAISLNFILEEARKTKMIVLRSETISASASADSMLQNLVTEICNKANIRDPKEVYTKIMPQLLNLKDEVLKVNTIVGVAQQTILANSLFAFMGIVGNALDSNILTSLFGKGVSKIFGVSMLQTQLAFKVVELVGHYYRGKISSETLNQDLLSQLYQPRINGFIPQSFNINIENFTMFPGQNKEKINQKIYEGQIARLSGRNGVGKSTFLRFLTHQVSNYEIEGQINIGGVSLPLVNSNYYNDTVLYLSQEIDVFNDSLAQNIFGTSEINDEKLEIFINSPLSENLGLKIKGIEWKFYSLKQKQEFWTAEISNIWVGQNSQSTFKLVINSLSGGEKKLLAMIRLLVKIQDLKGKNFPFNLLGLDELFANLSFDSNENIETDQISIFTWMRDTVFKLIQENPKTIFIFIDHTNDEVNSLFAKIGNDDNLQKRMLDFKLV